jgi:hypothetical protein
VDYFTCIVCLVNLEVAVEARGRILVDGEPIGCAQSSGSGIKSLRGFNDCCIESSPTLASQMLDGGRAVGRLQTLEFTVKQSSETPVEVASQKYSTRRRKVDHLINN